MPDSLHGHSDSASLFPDGLLCPDCLGDVYDPDTGEPCWCAGNREDVDECVAEGRAYRV